ncbi:hypothetical protein FACS1894166_00200 [Bacilli bacterium]|nr:hypothetical protein FACS1894166_00200 [Bacilli bacterium]
MEVLISDHFKCGLAIEVTVQTTRPIVITNVIEINRIRFQFQNPLFFSLALRCCVLSIEHLL